MLRTNSRPDTGGDHPRRFLRPATAIGLRQLCARRTAATTELCDRLSRERLVGSPGSGLEGRTGSLLLGLGFVRRPEPTG